MYGDAERAPTPLSQACILYEKEEEINIIKKN